MTDQERLQLLADIRDEITKLVFIQGMDAVNEDMAAYLLKKKVSTLRSMVSRGELAVCKPGGRKGKSASYFRKDDLVEYMTRNRVDADSDVKSKASTYNYFKKRA